MPVEVVRRPYSRIFVRGETDADKANVVNPGVDKCVSNNRGSTSSGAMFFGHKYRLLRLDKRQ